TPADARHLLARSEALDAVDARRLRQSRDRRPCLHDLASSTAVRLLGFVAQTKKPAFRRRLRPRSRSGRHSCRPVRAPFRLPFTAVHRTVHRPQHLHGSSPSTLDARVPAIQKPSARSHRMVDNSLITGSIEYSTFLNLPLDECIVNTPPKTREVIKREARKRRTQASDKKLRKARTVTYSSTDRSPKTRATARRNRSKAKT